MTFDMSNPIAYLDPLNCNLNHMMVMLLKDQLNEYLYDAELASLKLSVMGKSCGIDVRMYNSYSLNFQITKCFLSCSSPFGASVTNRWCCWRSC